MTETNRSERSAVGLADMSLEVRLLVLWADAFRCCIMSHDSLSESNIITFNYLRYIVRLASYNTLITCCDSTSAWNPMTCILDG